MGMMKLSIVTLLCFFGLSLAFNNPILRKLDPHLRYQHAQDDATGEYHLTDMWMKMIDLAEVARYNPRASNAYHLYTRANPTTSQPLIFNNNLLLDITNFDANKRIAILIHGWRDNAISDFNSVLVPAFLEAEDLNVIVVDWSAGANTLLYHVAQENSIASAIEIAAFINWMNSASGANPIQYHIVGHGLGGHMAGITGRHVNGNIAYITGLDPALLGWINHNMRFSPDDGVYTEVIHTNSGVNGFLATLAQVDFYPNGGESMPGCDSHACDHARSFHYFGESIRTGGFSGRACVNYLAAILESCNILPFTLNMGGLAPKFVSGVYHLQTNAAPPFSQ